MKFFLKFLFHFTMVWMTAGVWMLGLLVWVILKHLRWIKSNKI